MKKGILLYLFLSIVISQLSSQIKMFDDITFGSVSSEKKHSFSYNESWLLKVGSVIQNVVMLK